MASLARVVRLVTLAVVVAVTSVEALVPAGQHPDVLRLEAELQRQANAGDMAWRASSSAVPPIFRGRSFEEIRRSFSQAPLPDASDPMSVHHHMDNWRADRGLMSAEDAFAFQTLGRSIKRNQAERNGLPFTATDSAYVPLAGLPSQFSWSSQMPPVGDQGACGSCYIWSSAYSTMPARMAINDPSHFPSAPLLSTQYVLNCDKTDGGCAGGSLPVVWHFLAVNGTTRAACVPYQASVSQCSPTCTNTSDPVDLYKASDFVFDFTPDEIMYAIYRDGPVQTVFWAYYDLLLYSDGVYIHRDGASPAMGGHGVTITGWGYDEASGHWYWEIMNSWGPSWGQNGYAKFSMFLQQCQAEFGGGRWLRPSVFNDPGSDRSQARLDLARGQRSQFCRFMRSLLDDESVVEHCPQCDCFPLQGLHALSADDDDRAQ